MISYHFWYERSHHILKKCLICKFEANPQHYYNVIGRSGIFSEEDLHSQIDRIRYHGEWSTNTELNMIGALARIDVMSIDATDVDPKIGISIMFMFMDILRFRQNVIPSMKEKTWDNLPQD